MSLELDQSTDDRPATYMLTLVVPGVELRFEIASPDVARELNEFLRDTSGRTVFAERRIGDLDGLPVAIIKDDEHADRFFIRAARNGVIDVTIVDPIACDLVRAAAELANKL